MKTFTALCLTALLGLTSCATHHAQSDKPRVQIDPAVVARACQVVGAQQEVIAAIAKTYVEKPDDVQKVDMAVLAAKAALALCVSLATPVAISEKD